MRIWAALLLPLLLPGCAGSCQAVGHGAVGGGSVGGQVYSGGCAAVSSGAILDLNAETGCTVDGDVTSWANDGSVSTSFTQGTATQYPQCQTTCTGLGGGGPCVYFDGANDRLDGSGTTSTWVDLHNADDFTAYVVVEQLATQDGANGYVFATSQLATNVGVRVSLRDATGTTGAAINHRQQAAAGSNSLAGDTAATVTYGSGHVITTAYDYGAAGDDVATRVDGVSVFTEDTNAAPSAAAHTYVARVGMRADSASEPFGGYLYRLLVYDELHDAATIAANEAALDCALGGGGWPK